MIMVRCDGVKKTFYSRRGVFAPPEGGAISVLDGVSLEIEKGETLGLVGESGCGKTTLGKIILGILKPDAGRVELATKDMQAIFQNPQTSLDHKMKVFDIIGEGLSIRRKRADIRKKVEETCELVSLPYSALKKYPHQFSGGEKQRIAIARAIITGPEFIVCDEPVSSLDITIQLQILRLLKDIQKRLSITYLFISHNPKVVEFMSDRIAVMKSGRIAVS